MKISNIQHERGSSVYSTLCDMAISYEFKPGERLSESELALRLGVSRTPVREALTRLVADGLTKRLGQPFVVLNRPGANTNLGTLSIVRSRPDGYSLLITSFGLAANPSLYKNLGFEPLVDLEPITMVATNEPTSGGNGVP